MDIPTSGPHEMLALPSWIQQTLYTVHGLAGAGESRSITASSAHALPASSPEATVPAHFARINLWAMKSERERVNG